MDFLKSIGGKIVGGAVAVVVIISVVTWFTLSGAERRSILSDTGAVLKTIGFFIGWLAVVAVVPWATFFLIGRVGRLDSNLAGAVLVLAYTGLEAVLLAWLFNWAVRGAGGWTFFAAATLLAGVYNLFACDWIEEKVN